MRHRYPLIRALGFVPALALATTMLLVAPVRVAAATLDVCRSGCPYSQIAPALGDARNGDTIRVAKGTYPGGFAIDVSVTLLGAGAGRTIIKGGGPVITIGTFGAPSQPTVLIDGITVTGGVTHSSPLSSDVGKADVIALGGGIEVPPNADFTGGAIVTISRSLITGNRAEPTASVPTNLTCPGGPCPFAWARGGGIDSWGALALVDTTVSNNTAAGIASDSVGGGISIWDTGSLTLDRSRVTGNRAIASVPNGRFAEGGGIFADPGIELTIRDSLISDNVARLTSNLPFFVDGADPLDMNANGGGVHVGDGSTITIDRSDFHGNRAIVTDPNGQPYAFDAALHPGDGRLVMRDSSITNNHVVADVASTADAGPSGSMLDVDGPSTIIHTRITGNTSVVTSRTGLAQATGAVYAGGTASEAVLITDSVITGNTTIARSTDGSASVIGAGLTNDGRLVLTHDVIANNIGIARGQSGSAQGGGIWNGTLFNQPPIELTLNATSVTGNVLRGTSGMAIQGGGLFTTFPVTVNDSQIVHNRPDDCFGCLELGAVVPPDPSARARDWHLGRGQDSRTRPWTRDIGRL